MSWKFGGAVSAPPRQVEGALDGLVVFLNAGHGWGLQDGKWGFLRDLQDEGLVEDLGNADQLVAVAEHCLALGATVVPLRAVGRQDWELVRTAADPAVEWSGGWTVTQDCEFFYSVDAQDDSCALRVAEAVDGVSTASARFPFAVPTDGSYPIYVWGSRREATTATEPTRARQAYTVRGPDGRLEVTRWVDHRSVGGGWVYLGTFPLRAGVEYSLITDNAVSSPLPAVVLADAIRVGNGRVSDPDTAFARPMDEMCAAYWLRSSVGTAASAAGREHLRRIHSSSSQGDWGNSILGPPKMARHMAVADGARRHLFIALHTNSLNGEVRGALGIHNGENPIVDPTWETPNQRALAQLLGKRCNEELRELTGAQIESQPGHFALPWVRRTVHSQYPGSRKGEIKAAWIGQEIDAAILEVAFHDAEADALLLTDPKTRDALGRAVARAAVDYFHQFGPLSGQPRPPNAPERPQLPAVWTEENGDVVLSWQPSPEGAGGGGPPDRYLIYHSEDAFDFRQIEDTAETSFRWPSSLPIPVPAFLRVAAINAGGESMPSATVACRSIGEPPELLLVEGRGKVRRELGPMQKTPRKAKHPPGTDEGWAYRVGEPLYAHSSGDLVTVARALDLDFDSCPAERLHERDLASYSTVIWLAGRHAVADDLFSADDIAALRTFVGSGGRLWLSGSRLAHSLSQQPGPRRDFLHQVMGVAFRETLFGGARARVRSAAPEEPEILVDLNGLGGRESWIRDGIVPVTGFRSLMSHGPWTEAVAAIERANDARIRFFAFPLEALGAVPPLDGSWSDQKQIEEDRRLRSALLASWLTS